MANIFTLLGGLGLFLYGTSALSSSIQQIAGARLRGFIRTVTANRFTGVLAGTLTTAIIQSSAVTTVMAVSFVNAGLMALPQAIAVILGAHIGTTVTVQLIAFKISYLALPIIAIGAFTRVFSHSERWNYIGDAFFAFGILFFGLTLMTEALDPLKNEEAVQGVLREFARHPVIPFLTGMFITMLVQSSSVTTGLTIALALSSLITFEQAVPLILGENIGTTITANIVALRSSIAAQQVARAHFVTNAIGAVLALILLTPFMSLVRYLSPAGDLARQIANAHTYFNILTTLLFLPFINVVARLTRLLVSADTKKQQALYYLEETSLADPGVALDQADRALIEMTSHIIDSVRALASVAVKKQTELGSAVLLRTIEVYQRKITEYLDRIMGQKLSRQQAKELQSSVRIMHELEHIQDHAEKLKEVCIYLAEEGREFHALEKREIRNFFDQVVSLLKVTLSVMEHKKNPHEVFDQYEKLKARRDELRVISNERYRTRRTAIAVANYYNDLISALEEIGKKCRNIAKVVIE